VSGVGTVLVQKEDGTLIKISCNVGHQGWTVSGMISVTFWWCACR